jgi:hypothetical protein
MPRQWLYAIAKAADATFDLQGVDSYRDLVEDGRINSDGLWYISQNAKNITPGEDYLLIYTGDQDLGIIGFAKILKVDSENGVGLLIRHDLGKSRRLLNDPIPAATVRSWKLNLRKNVVSLAPVENLLRPLLSKRIGSISAINVEEQDLTDAEIDEALHENRLRLGIVPTGSQQALVRCRHGQARIRELAIENYQKCCAVCDVTDRALLIASHVVGWAKAPADRGNLANVICLCRMHDALFEAGYWSLGNSLKLLKRTAVRSATIRGLLSNMTSFRKPLRFAPASRFVKHHREENDFAKIAGRSQPD